MQELNTSQSYLASALLMVAQAWRANNNNVNAASKVQKLYITNVECLLSLNRMQNSKIYNIAQQAEQLASIIPPDDISEIEKCYFYAEQLFNYLKSSEPRIKRGF